MHIEEKPQLLNLVKRAMAAYGKSLPEAGIVSAWWDLLSPFPLNVVAQAMAEYQDENGEFAPVPAGIAKRCKTMDGRPGVEEAWAIALASLDENDTIMWTPDIAEALGACQAVLETDGPIGARMAFKEAYTRIVMRARAEHRPAGWMPSLGHDKSRHAPVLTKAVSAGLLPAPFAAKLLPPPAPAPATHDTQARAQLEKIRKMLADTFAEKERASELHAKRERDELAALKARAAAMTAAWRDGAV